MISNSKICMLDENFCVFLEYELTKAFPHSADPLVKSFWCDGILLPHSEKELSQKNVNDKRQILMRAYIGKDGQDMYDLILNFGRRSLSRHARGLDLQECVPDKGEAVGMNLITNPK